MASGEFDLPNGYRLTPFEARDYTRYHLQRRGGELWTNYCARTRVYGIAGLDVIRTMRRQGIGTELVQVAARHAEYLGARAVIAALVSRESYEVMKNVFGDECIQASPIGDFAPEGEDRARDNQTQALLYKTYETS